MFSPNELLHNSFVLKKTHDTLWDEIGSLYGLTRIEIDVLAFISNNPEFNTARDIVDYRMIAKSHVSKATDNLTARGLIRGEQDSTDRRKIRLIPTEAAAEIICRIRTHQSYFEEKLLDGLSADDKVCIMKLFSRLSDNARKMLDEQTSAQ